MSETTSSLKRTVEETRRLFNKGADEVTTRRLHRPDGDVWMDRNEGYLEVLPIFKGKNFVEWIERKTQEGNPISILDIGTGAGFALLDLRKLFSADKLKIVGVGNPRETNELVRDVSREAFSMATREDLREADVELVPQNFVDLHKFIPLSSFDVVTAVYSLTWINYPHISLMRKIWRFLKPGGVAFIAPFELNLIDNQTGANLPAARYLRDNCGFEIEQHNGGLSFERNTNAFPNVFRPRPHSKTDVFLK